MGESGVDVDIATIGALFGNRARAAMLTGMFDRPGVPAGELARRAGVSPSTATAHLNKLVDGGLVTVRSEGRMRLYELASAEVATAIEGLAVLSPQIPVRSLSDRRTATALREARTCYDHLAGRLGVMLHDHLLQRGDIVSVSERDYELSRRGERSCESLGLDLVAIRKSRRMFARSCLDWSERVPHLAGALPAALLTHMLEQGWIERHLRNRSVRITESGAAGLEDWCGMNVNG